MTTERRPEEYGLRVLDARRRFVPAELIFAEIFAADRLSRLARLSHFPQSSWRYETLAILPFPPADDWASWERQQADPLIKAEAERQSAFHNASLHLGRRLMSEELQAFARSGSLAGEWIPVPTTAWEFLRFAFDRTLQSWRHGHALGGGLDLWDIRVFDPEGVRLSEAALSYGATNEVQTVHRHLAYKSIRKVSTLVPTVPPPPLTRMEREMASVPNPLASIPDVGAYEASSDALQSSLHARLKNGDLLAFGKQNEKWGLILQSEWRRGDADFCASLLQTNALTISDIIVRQPHPMGENGADKSNKGLQASGQAPSWSKVTSKAWFLSRCEQHPQGRWHSLEKDWTDAKTHFAESSKVPRKDLELLRQQFVPAHRIRAGAGGKL